jgi:CRP/FNR family cyclic AMP-dependent transcriptional regulator
LIATADSISIIDADPELEDLLPPIDRERARRETRTRIRHLSVGDWDVAAAEELDSHHRGFLIVDGLISREVEVLGRRCVELLGAGDVIRPWSWDEEGSHVQAEVGWVVLEPAGLAVLNHHLVVRMTPWPQLGLELFNRGTRRAHALAVSLAIAHHQRVDDRLLLTLWHLAER